MQFVVWAGCPETGILTRFICLILGLFTQSHQGFRTQNSHHNVDSTLHSRFASNLM